MSSCFILSASAKQRSLSKSFEFNVVVVLVSSLSLSLSLFLLFVPRVSKFETRLDLRREEQRRGMTLLERAL
jgi:hypothetical protein